MAVKKTKKLSGQATVTTINTDQKIPVTDANGKVTLISLANLKTALLAGMNLNGLYDGIFIMYHRKSDDYPLMVKPHKWTSLQNRGEIADGVVVVEGGKILVVAPTESTSKLTWSSAAISGGGTTTTDRVTAINDWNGKANTAATIKASKADAITNTAQYAPGYCNLYSRAGLTAGKWWLPSLGEMFMIYANMTKINYALSLITGATKLVEDWYWTSTETSATYAWSLTLSDGDANLWNRKASSAGRGRAVSAFIV
jgi:phage baseplate assembly protein gpV